MFGLERPYQLKTFLAHLLLLLSLGCAAQRKHNMANQTADTETSVHSDSGMLRVAIANPQFAGDFKVKSVFGQDYLNALYEYTVEGTYSGRPEELDTLLGTPVTLVISTPDSTDHFIRGVLEKVEALSTQAGTEVTLTLTPWQRNLARASGLNVFVQQNAPQMVETVFKRYHFRDYEMDIRERPATAPFYLQYRETDWNFICRTLEDVGIRFFFRHDSARTVMVMSDTGGSEHYSETAQIVRRTKGRVAERYSLGDKNFGGESLMAVAGNPQTPFEIFDFPGGFQNNSEASRFARLRHQERMSKSEVFMGTATDFPPRAGERVRVKGDSGEYYVTSVQMRFDRNPEQGDGFQCNASFEAVPSSAPWRPERRTVWPTVGVQSGSVVEVQPAQSVRNSLPRARIRFSWQKKSDTQSVWMPLAESIVPLVKKGSEVIITFRDGEIYDPIVTAVIKR